MLYIERWSSNVTKSKQEGRKIEQSNQDSVILTESFYDKKRKSYQNGLRATRMGLEDSAIVALGGGQSHKELDHDALRIPHGWFRAAKIDYQFLLSH